MERGKTTGWVGASMLSVVSVIKYLQSGGHGMFLLWSSQVSYSLISFSIHIITQVLGYFSHVGFDSM